MNHSLQAKGAAFEANGEIAGFTGSTGTGRAKCSCGWLSEELSTGRARKLAYAEHKTDPEPEVEEVVEDDPTPEPEAVEDDPDCDLLADMPKPKKPADLGKMKARINALLAKAESSDFPEERDAFNAGAEKLMLRLGISIAELEAEGKVKTNQKIVEVKRTFPGNYSISMIPFVCSIARGFGHLTILQSKTAGLARNAFIIGHESDVEQFIILLDSLSIQVMSALRVWQRENIESRRGLTEMVKYLQHRSFIEGFGAKVGERLEARRTTEEVGISTGTALVLAGKESRIQDWITEQYPVLGKGRSGRGHSSIGFYAGQTSGATANLNDPSIGGKKGELKS